MTQTNIIEDVAALFMETGENHHRAFIKTNGVDPEWPLWYANYLHDQLGKVLNTELTKSEIIYQLLMLEKKRALEAPEANWPEYYATILVDQFVN